MIQAVQDACIPLLTFPKLGPAREELAPGLRAMFKGRYAVYYVGDDRAIIIVRVLHGSPDKATIATGGGFDDRSPLR